MEYNDTIILSQKGFHIDKHLMLPIGIRSGYRFWGVYEHENESNLILSSLPHAAWGGLLRLRLRLKNGDIRPVFQEISEIFKAVFCESHPKDCEQSTNHINILSLNTSISIDSHYIVSIIVELPKYRKTDSRENRRYHRSYDEGYELLHHIAKKVSDKVQENVSIANKLYDKNGFTAVEIKPIKSLLNESVSDNYNQLIRFEYDVNSMLLKPCDKTDENKLLRKYSEKSDNGVDRLPFLYTAIFDPLSKIIRLHQVKSSHREKLFEIDVSYDCFNEEQHGHVNVATKKTECLTCEMLDKISLTDGSVISSIKKNTTRYSKHHEEGSIVVRVKTTESEESFKKNLNELLSKKYSIKASTRQISQYKVFVSLRKSFKDERWQFIQEALAEYGLLAISTEDSAESSITERVIEDMKESAACIQIYSIGRDSVNKMTENDRYFSTDLLNAEWLLFEAGVTRGLDLKPLIRMVDTTHVSKYNWEKCLRIQRDAFLQTFQTYSVSTEGDHFCNVFRKVVAEISEKVYKNQ